MKRCCRRIRRGVTHARCAVLQMHAAWCYTCTWRGVVASVGTNECEVVTTPKGPAYFGNSGPSTNIHMYDYSFKIRHFELL